MAELLAYHRVNRVEVIKVTFLGAFLGLLIPSLGLAINSWLINPIFCQEASQQFCQQSDLWGYYVSATLLSIVAVALLANWGIYRPIVVAFASLVSLWGLKSFIDLVASHSLVEYLFISATLFGATYLLFYWLMRAYNFGLSVALAVAAILVIRWTLLV